jgi:hypothetical protein
MNQENQKDFNISDTTDVEQIPSHIGLEDVRYFEDKVKLNPKDKKAKLQLELILATNEVYLQSRRKTYWS